MATLTDIFMRKNEENNDVEDTLILEELHQLGEALDYAYARFEMQSNSDLVDASIFEIESLKARYRYLLGIARSKNLKATK